MGKNIEENVIDDHIEALHTLLEIAGSTKVRITLNKEHEKYVTKICDLFKKRFGEEIIYGFDKGFYFKYANKKL